MLTGIIILVYGSSHAKGKGVEIGYKYMKYRWRQDCKTLLELQLQNEYVRTRSICNCYGPGWWINVAYKRRLSERFI